MIKHLYRRTVKKNGRELKVWYFWYYDENGKQIRRSCGQDGKPCLTKKEAEAFLANLKDEDLVKNKLISFNDFAAHFYDTDSPYLIKMSNRGKEFQPKTLYQKRLYLKYFLDKFGMFNIQVLKPVDVENWILTLKLSTSAMNNLITTINEIGKELYVYKLLPYPFQIEHVKRKVKNPKGILMPEEIKVLFPSDYSQLLKVWHVTGETDLDTYKFATMIYTILSTGMRSSEIRALTYEQIINNSAILLNAMINSNNERVSHLKKGTEENLKWRIAILPERTQLMIQNLRLMETNKQTNYVFEHKGEVVDSFYLNSHFKVVLRNNGIDEAKRNITIHSLRFTYNTMMKKEISGQDLRLMMGHTTEAMTEYYDKSEALDNLPELLKNKGIIDGVFS